MLKIHQFAIMCAPTTSQYAAVEALRNGDEDVAMMREEYNGRRRYVLDVVAADINGSKCGILHIRFSSFFFKGYPKKPAPNTKRTF